MICEQTIAASRLERSRSGAALRLVFLIFASTITLPGRVAEAGDAGFGETKSGDLRIALTGHPTVVFDSGRNACAPIDTPDINPRAYRDKTGQVHMFALHFVNRALRGPDLEHLAIDCHVALDSSLDADPSHYADRSYVAATWTDDGQRVSALIHHEYHADTHGRCRVAGDLGCWFNSVLAYRSDDGGSSFGKANPLVIASAPFTQDVEQGRHRGFFNPSNMVADAGYVYAMTSTTGWSGQPPGSCLFRTTDPSKPALWRAFDGTGFTIRYTDPYRPDESTKPSASTTRPAIPKTAISKTAMPKTAIPTTAITKPCRPIAPFLFPVGSLVRHMPSKLWLAVFQAAAGGPYPVDGFYYAVGRDLTHWSAPTLLLAGQTSYADLCKVGPSIIAYPSLLDPHSESRNFDTIEDHPVLFFTVIQVVGCQTRERMLVRQPIALTADTGQP